MATELWAIVVTIAATIIGAFGAVFLKKGSQDFNLNPIKQLKNTKLLLGIFLYGLSTIIFIPLLRYGDLSILYPAVSTSYVFVSILSVKMLNEKMNKLKWIGIALILLGVIFISFASAS